jgi:hypothetical protein
MRGYLSKYWGLTVSANHHLEKNNDNGDAWVRKAILHLWSFAHEMWEHQNSILHDTQLESSRQMRDAEINDAIMNLYENVDSYSAEDKRYFDVPLTIRLCKPPPTFEETMASECKDIDSQVGKPCINWPDDNESVLPPSALCKDSYECFSRRADWICSQVHSDESIEYVEFPSRTGLKNPKSLALMLY